MVKVSSLSFSYGNGKLISDLSFMLETGRIMAILGPNGVGKTTLLKILAGLLKPAEGSFTAEKDITYVPQIFSTGVNYTVYNMVLLGRAGHIGLFSSPDENDREKALDAIKKTGIEKLAGRRFSEISGGEKQLTMIARALASGADILLLDEPTSDLDIKNQGRILELMGNLSAEAGFTIIFSTHDPSHALAVSDSTMFLGREGVSLFGMTDTVLTEENVGRFYLTDVKITKIEIGGKYYRYCLPIYNVRHEKSKID